MVGGDHFRGEQHLQVGGQLLAFAAEEGLFPDGTGTAVVMIARNDVDGHTHAADGAAGF